MEGSEERDGGGEQRVQDPHTLNHTALLKTLPLRQRNEEQETLIRRSEKRRKNLTMSEAML